MTKYIALATKNLWRNKRRTLITVISIYFALSSVLFMKGINLGGYEKAIDGVVRIFTGYLQITTEGYWDDQSIENTFDKSSIKYDILDENENIKGYVNRLQSFALGAHDAKTKGLLVVGTELENEKKMTNIQNKLVEGQFFSEGQKEVVLTQKLASYLDLNVNDTLVLIGQGYHGVSAADKFVVSGIIHVPYPEIDKQTLYMDLSVCQDFYSATGLLSSVVIDIKDPSKLIETQHYLESKLPNSDFDVITWHTMLGDMKALMESDMQGTNFMGAILFLIVGFGIFEIVLMMSIERQKEFAVMLAIGMKKWQLRLVFILEMIFIGILGLLMIVPFTLPFMYYLNRHPLVVTGAKAEQLIAAGLEPLIPVAWHSDYIIGQVIIMIFVIIIASIYPIYKAINIKDLPVVLKK